MHVVILVLGLLGSLGYWYYRLKAAADTAHRIGDFAGQVRGKYRRGRFRRKAEAATLASIDDPGLAAAVLLVSIVETGRLVSADDERFIRDWLQRVAGDGKPDETLAFARWASREVVDVNEVLRRLLPLLRQSLEARERDELIEAATALTGRGGAAEPAQAHAVEMLRKALAVKSTAA